MGTPVQSEPEGVVREWAIWVLGQIGVSGNYPDPATEFAELGADELNSAWLSGAVHPISMRGLATLLMASLPKETLRVLGVKFVEASYEEVVGKAPRKHKSLMDLASLELPGLNNYLDEPIVSVNPAASARDVDKSMHRLLKEWKQSRSLREQRIRPEKFDEYLRTWDLREGWCNGLYDFSEAQDLKTIGKSLKRKPSTVLSQFRSAFELIVGLPFTPELLLRVMLPALFLTEHELESFKRRHSLSSRSRRDVPDRVLSPRRDMSAGLIGTLATASKDDGVRQLTNDIRELIRKGFDDVQVVSQLGLGEASIKLVAYFRNHGDVLG